MFVYQHKEDEIMRMSAAPRTGFYVLLLCLCVLVASGQTDHTMTRVSVSSSGMEANGPSERARVSADGRWVVFRSFASNLVAGDTNAAPDIFVHDRATGETSRVSVSSTGVQANGGSAFPDISADGRYVAFPSEASNLVPGDTNGVEDVFVHDRWSGETVRVSVSSDGSQGRRSTRSYARISAEGQATVFATGSALVPEDTNRVIDVFVHDSRSGDTVRVSVASDGTQTAQHNDGGHLAISGDGSAVAFRSQSSDLVPNDTNPSYYQDIFVHDLGTAQTTRINVASDGSQSDGGAHEYPDVSDDGRYVVFYANANNLVPERTWGLPNVYVRDRQSAETRLLSVTWYGQGGNGNSKYPALSGDGRVVAFESNASDLVADRPYGGPPDIFLHDRDRDEDGILDEDPGAATSMISLAEDGTKGNGFSHYPDIDRDGDVVAFESASTNLVPDDGNGVVDIFVWSSAPLDSDSDGVADEADLCAETLPSAVVDPASGCSVAQLCPCEGPRDSLAGWKNHGRYVSCVAHAGDDFVDRGLITEAEKDTIVSSAARSSCGESRGRRVP